MRNVRNNSLPVNNAFGASKEQEVNQEFLSDLQIWNHLKNRDIGRGSGKSIKRNLKGGSWVAFI